MSMCRARPRRGLRRQQALDRNRHRRRVGEQRVAIVIDQLGRLGMDVHAVGHRDIGAEIEFAQDPEQHQGGEALAVGRAFFHGVAAIIGRDRRRVEGGVLGLGKVLQRVQAAEAVQVLHQRGTGGALIEGARAALRDVAQALAEQRLGMAVAGARCLAARQEERRGAGILRQQRGVIRPVEGDARGDRIAVLGIVDGAGEQPLQRQRAMIGVQPGPGRDGAGHGDGVGAGLGDLAFEPERFQLLDGGGGRRAAAAVQRDGRLALRRIEHEAVAADAGHVRLDHALRRHRGQRGVHRIAAGREDLQPGGGRQRVRGGDRGVARHHRRAGGSEEVSSLARNHGS